MRSESVASQGEVLLTEVGSEHFKAEDVLRNGRSDRENIRPFLR
jgi:hypothetical protein